MAFLHAPAPRRRPAFLVLFLLAACEPARTASQHPLDPLTAHEMDRARAVLEQHDLLSGRRRVSMLDLLEPPKADVLAGRDAPRRAFAVLYDPDRNATSEAVIDVDHRRLESLRVVPGVEPPLDAVDADVADAVTRSSDAWRRALARRHLSPGDVSVVAWSTGNFGDEDPSRGRLVRALTFVRAASRNEMSRPVEGLVALVDVAGRRVLDVQDSGSDAVPTPASERDAWRPLPRPTTHVPGTLTESDAPLRARGVELHGHAIVWRRWRFRAAVRPREGLVLYDVRFDDGTALRSVLYRASLSEMVVPYGDPGGAWYFRNSFDVGELGIGANVSSLAPGVDCPADADWLDATLAGPSGAPRRVARAIAVYERDGGLAWKHAASGARAAELVVFSVSRVGNYDYGFEWTFREDGSISHQVLLTGVMAARGGSPPDSVADAVAAGVAAVQHQHFFNYRLDLDVDGASPNRVEAIETHAMTPGSANVHGGGFAMAARAIATELDASRIDVGAGIEAWRVVNPAHHDALGEPTGYELVPGAQVSPLAAPGSSVRRRAGFLDAPLWVTPQVDSERWAAGDYPNQSAGGDGLPRWTRSGRAVLDTDVVLWYTLGLTHVPRPEDWPVMPVERIGFTLRPVGFFDRNPTLGRAR